MQLSGWADWALMIATHDALRRDLDQLHATAIREHVLRQLPAPARLLHRRVWLPRYARTTPPL
jgi:hypothetical protein